MPRASRRVRIGVAVAVVALIIVVIALNWLAHFWTDFLWFRSIGFTSVFRGVLVTKALLALVFIAIFFVLLLGNLVVADRVAPAEPAPGVADELVGRYRDFTVLHGRAVRIVTAAVFAFLAGVGANREWNNWDLLRYHTSFVDPTTGRVLTDPEFHRNLGFYVFELPFFKFLVGWAFEALVVMFIVTAVAHYLNGGIHLLGPERRVTPAVKTHLSVLLAVLALVKGADYYFLQRYELVLSRSHVVNGATATEVHANKPALTLLAVIALIAAGLFLYNARQKGWTLPIVAVVLWGLVYILVGAVYPALYQALRVSPSELTREAPYIQRNISATRAAYGLDNVRPDPSYRYSPTVTTSQVSGPGVEAAANRQTLANVRLLDPSVNLLNTFDKYQGQRSYYQFNDLSLDRYTMDSAGGKPQVTATVASVRELKNSAVPSGFVNQHLEYTHGYGAVLAPVGESGVNIDGTPDFSLQALPPQGTPPLTPKGSQIYYGLGSTSGGYVIAASKTKELDYEDSAGTEVTTSYTGSGGVAAGSLLRRAAFAFRFGDLNFLLSGQITPSSRVMYIRNIQDRVRKAAPFLKYDADPYAVILDGKVYWVIDAYTTTDNYPYSQNANTQGVPASSGLNSTFNYVRNSVKVVISAYDGSMHFFVVDPTDPIVRVYERAFPDLFTPVSRADSIIPGIVEHFRYPEDIFRVQTNMYGRYHLTDAAGFYTQAQAWTVSPDPGSGPLNQSTSIGQAVLGSNGQVITTVAKLKPQYVLAHLPGSTQQQFVLVSPFVPVSSSTERQNLTAYMTASWDPQNYGQLQVFQTPPGQTVDGPGLITNAIQSNADISAELTLLNQQSSIVELGEVDVVPLDQTILYVQPVYVESSSNQIPELRDVVVVYDDTAYHSRNASLDGALCNIVNPGTTVHPFGAYCNTSAAQSGPLVTSGLGSTTGGQNGNSPTSTTLPSSGNARGATTTVPAPPAGATVASLLQQAQASWNAAQADLKAGNLAAYQADIARMETYVAQAQKKLAPGSK